MPQDNMQVSDFTTAVSPLIDFVKDKYDPSKGDDKEGFCISDVIDENGLQYVDLVQEGGGVLGIALAGYTYVLEKMGVAFMKMAGTSAGSINTLLLSCVTTRTELRRLKECTAGDGHNADQWRDSEQYKPERLVEDNYFDTRTEKLLQYLAAKDLADLVDGFPTWRTLLLGTFKGEVKFDNIKRYFGKVKRRAILMLTTLVILILTGVFLSWVSFSYQGLPVFQWIFRISAVVFILSLGYLLYQAMMGRLLYKHAERFGINPGNNFEDWVMGILRENGIDNVSQLKNKQQIEHECFKPRFQPCCSPKSAFAVGIDQRLSPEERAYYNKVRELKSNLRSTLTADTFGVPDADAIDELNTRAIDLSKQINFEWQYKHLIADELVEVFNIINSLKYRKGSSDNEPMTPFMKELAIVSSDVTNQIKTEFPAMHKMYWGENYDISPAKYVRASMSIPFFFKPFEVKYMSSQKEVIEREWRELVHLNKRIDDGGSAMMVDGGMISNFPINVFYNNNSAVPLKPTVGIKLEYEDDAKTTPVNSIGNLAGNMVSTMRFFYDRDFMSKHNDFKKTVRSIDTGAISWLNFALTNQEKIELFFRGALTAAIFLMGKQKPEDRAGYVQTLVHMGKAVSYGGSTFSIFKENEVDFQTEDNSLDDVHFDWCKYKSDRVLLYSNNVNIQSQLKRKASFNVRPAKNKDVNS